MAEIKIGKLISGEMIVGKEGRGGLDDCYMVQVIPQQGPGGSQAFNVMLLPVFIPISKDAVHIPAERIITTIDAPENLAGEYTRATSSLYVPSAGEATEILRKNPVLK